MPKYRRPGVEKTQFVAMEISKEKEQSTLGGAPRCSAARSARQVNGVLWLRRAGDARLCFAVPKSSQGGGDRPPTTLGPGDSAKHSAKSAKTLIAHLMTRGVLIWRLLISLRSTPDQLQMASSSCWRPPNLSSVSHRLICWTSSHSSVIIRFCQHDKLASS